jgi:hypothetical protein
MRNTSKLRHLVPLALLTGVFCLPGCAKAPSGVTGTSGTQLIVSMTVSGKIRSDYYYFVLFNPITTPAASTGPVPVVAPPWGNGFAAGAFTAYLRYDGSQPYSNYGIYTVVAGSNLLQSQGPGAPTQYTPVQQDPGTGQLTGNTIQFQIPLSQIAATSGLTVSQIQYVQVNFVATNRIPVNPTDTTPKLFDALGDPRTSGGLNDPVTLAVTQAGLFQNSNQITPESSGDVGEFVNGSFQSNEDPDLDITNWTIEVRT